MAQDVAPSVWQQRRLRIARQNAEYRRRQEEHRREKERARAEAARAAQEAEEEEEEKEEADAPQPRKKKNKKKPVTARGPRLGVLPGLPEMNANRWTAVIIWLIGAYLTRSFLVQITVPVDLATPIAFLLQWLLTKAQSPLWRGQGYPKMAILATMIDGGVNSAGAWPYLKNLGKTDFWAMVRDIYQASAAPPKPGDPPPTPIEPTVATIVACSIVTGVATAAAAEYYWNLK